MDGLYNFKNGVKRTSAVILAALILAGGAESALISADAAEVQQEASAATLSDSDRGVIFADSRTDFRDESIYFLITTRFYDGDSSNNTSTSEDVKAQNLPGDPSWRGDFKGLIDKLDYIKALGFTAIWITPVVQNDSGYDYHGYHAYDFSAVDTRYESNGVTYQTLIDACHKKGIKVIQDIVLNHTCNWGEKHLLQITDEVYGGGRSKYVMPDGASLDPDNIYHHNGFCGGGDWDNQEAQKKTIADDCFDLNTENPKVYNYLVDCYTNYINMGVDGFRVDTVKHISRLTFNSVFLPAFKKAGGEKFYMFGEVCTKGHDVWYRDNPPISTCFYTWADDSSWTSRWSDSEASNTALLDEHYAAHMDTGSQPTSDNAFLNGNEYHTPDNSKRSGMDSIDFQMHWSFNSAGQAFQTALGEDRYFSDATWNVVYVDSHDYGPDECQTLRYNGGTEAWAENLALMFTFRGIPCVYYGSEIEFQAGKPIDVGPNQPLANTGRAYYGDHLEGTVGTNGFATYGNLSGEVKNTLQSTLSQHIMRLNRIRQAIPALRKGQYSTDGCSGGISFKRRYTDSTTDSFACVAISGTATFSGIPNGTYVDAVTGDVQNVSGGTLTANVSGKGNMKVYVLDTAKTPAPGRVIPNGDFLNDGGAGTIIPEVPVEPEEEILPTNISIPSTLTVSEGKSSKLNVTFTPSNTTKKDITWTSSNTAVATVNGGTVTGIKKGTAKITAKSVNGLTSTCTVTVEEGQVIWPTGVTLNNTSLSLNVGETGSLTATVLPADADNKTVTWTSSNTSVATVANGTVKAVAKGTAVITAETCNGLTATCTVKVTKQDFIYVDKGFYFEKPSGWGSSINVYFFNKASNTTVGAAWPGTAMTSSGNNIYRLEYTNTDSNVVMIFNDGNNQSPARDMGGYEIKDQGYYTTSGFDHLVVKEDDPIEVESVTLNKSSLSLVKDNSATLTATVSPSNADDPSITWTSSNTSVATVSASGVVKGVAKGSATITAASSNGKKATCTVTVTENVTQLVNNSKISTTSQTINKTVTLTGAASGGTTPYKYAFYYKRTTSSNWITMGTAFGTATTATLTPASAGTFNFKVIVKDNNGQTAEKTFNYTATDDGVAPTNNSSVSSGTLNVGQTLTIKGAASGGTTPYKYAYYYKRVENSTWRAIGTEFGTATSATLTPASAGTFDIKVIVKGNNSKTSTKTFSVTFKEAKALENNSTVSGTNITLGNKLTVTGKASGGSGAYQYSFFYKRTTSENWITMGTQWASTSATLKPSTAGTFDIKVVVRDKNNTSNTKRVLYTVKFSSSKALENNSTVSGTNIALGNTLTITGKASGGSGAYQYAFFYKRTTSENWITMGTQWASTSATLKPSTVGTFDIKVVVRDKNKTSDTKRVLYTVKFSSATTLTNNSSVASTSVAVGKAITLKGAASGGTGSYKYAYYYKRTTSSNWISIGTEFGTATSASFTPSSAGSFDLMVKVMDGSGQTVTKTFAATAK